MIAMMNHTLASAPPTPPNNRDAAIVSTSSQSILHSTEKRKRQKNHLGNPSRSKSKFNSKLTLQVMSEVFTKFNNMVAKMHEARVMDEELHFTLLTQRRLSKTQANHTWCCVALLQIVVCCMHDDMG